MTIENGDGTTVIVNREPSFYGSPMPGEEVVDIDEIRYSPEEWECLQQATEELREKGVLDK